MDLINRQTAIYAIMNTFAKCLARDKAIEAINGVPAADTDISAYSDKLWKTACERGKSEAVRWIPVTERLPEKDGDYLVTFALLNIQVVEVCAYQRGEWDKGAYDAVLAWMPLPEPYVQSNSKN